MVAKVNRSGNENADKDVLIKRVFDAPRELVFQAWIDPDALTRWYAPHGCSTVFHKLEVREGGQFHSCIRTPDGHDCWCKGVYREVVKPERLVYTMEVSDAHGNSATPEQVGMDPDWPQQTVVTVTFVEAAKQTVVTLHQTVSESLAARTGALPSWLQMFDRLADHLAPK